MSNDILNNLNDSPTTLYTLGKATGLGATALTLELIGLARQGKVEVKDGGIVLAQPVVVDVAGPTGAKRTGKVAERLNRAREVILQMSLNGATMKGMCAELDGSGVKYSDILLVARELELSGLIRSTTKGRTLTFWVA
jgi:hypothetical protein